MMEALESRQMLSLLGVLPGLPTTNVIGPPGSLTYSATTHAFDATGVPVSVLLSLSPFNVVAVGPPSSFDLHITVDNSGNASSGSQANDLTITGSVDVNGDNVPDFTGTLLTGTIVAMGSQDSGTNDVFDFHLVVNSAPPGSFAATYFGGQDIGIVLTTENSTFNGTFTSDFSALVKGTVGPIPGGSGGSPIVISGFKFQDMKGDGLTPDDTSNPIANVTIQLYKDANGSGTLDGNDTLVASQQTTVAGAYSFGGLTPGTYFVKEVTPTGYIQTGPISGTYTVNATAGAYTNLDFDNFKKGDCQLYNVCYTIDCWKHVSDITGQLHQGDTVTVCFTIKAPETISFVAYTAPDPYFNANDASMQKIFSVDTETFTQPGTYCETVTLPCSYYQVDLVCGYPIATLGPAGSNIFYTPQGRLHDSDNGGTTSPYAMNNCLSGSVYVDTNNNGKHDWGESGISGVKITLTGTDLLGHAVTKVVYTDKYGNYSFSGLMAGTYTITETPPAGYVDGKDAAGNLGGTVGNDVISSIVLGPNNSGSNYNFGERNA